MKRIIWIIVCTLLILPMATEAAGGKNMNRNCSLTGLLKSLPKEDVSSGEAADLLYMREEEKLARDTYLSLYEEWTMTVFRQIAQAERRHMEAALVLIKKYGLVDPVGDNGLGVFSTLEFQTLYDELTAAGSVSELNALLVGLAIEDVDIYDLQNAYEATDNEDLQVLYQNLMLGSRNHLRAFDKLLRRYGESYVPVYLSPEEYEEIIHSPKEKGLLDADGELMCGGGKRRK